MSAEQGDVEVIREALESARYSHGMGPALAALDRLAAALERVERERDVYREAAVEFERVASSNASDAEDAEDRAEKAERALAEMREAADYALHFIEAIFEEGDDPQAARLLRAALRPEDTSDES